MLVMLVHTARSTTVTRFATSRLRLRMRPLRGHKGSPSYPAPPIRNVRLFSFVQAEDGIRDLTVTGVQTCALPISADSPATWTRAASSSKTAPSCTARSRLLAQSRVQAQPLKLSFLRQRRPNKQVLQPLRKDRKSVV